MSRPTDHDDGLGLWRGLQLGLPLAMLGWVLIAMVIAGVLA